MINTWDYWFAFSTGTTFVFAIWAAVDRKPLWFLWFAFLFLVNFGIDFLKTYNNLVGSAQ